MAKRETVRSLLAILGLLLLAVILIPAVVVIGAWTAELMMRWRLLP